jgi:hypothetical protein
MGSCLVSGKALTEPQLIHRITSAIESGDIRSLKFYASRLLAYKSIDDEIKTSNFLSLNALGLALRSGKLSSFIFLHQNCNASIKTMEFLFDKASISSLHIICLKGFVEILKYYLPFYIEEITEFPEIQEFASNRLSSVWVDDSRPLEENYPDYLPVHIATIREDIHLLSYIHTYFKDKSFVPRLLDMEYKENLTGENCVLLACRIGSYKMIVFFHKHCKLNFRVKNSHEHNAINVLVEGSRTRPNNNYLNSLRYLVETVGLDIEHHYIFSLLTAEDPLLVKYIEMRLKLIGNHATKDELKNNKTRLMSYDGHFTNSKDESLQLNNRCLSVLRIKEGGNSTE